VCALNLGYAVLWVSLLFGLSIYLLTRAVVDSSPNAEAGALAGATLLAAALFGSVFVVRRYLLTRRVQRHSKGKGSLSS